MEKGEIPKKAIYRLAIYRRCLSKLHENELATVSSSALAAAAGVKPALLRRDLAYLGQFGTRGLGYGVEELLGAIDEGLGREALQPVILVGAGNLGAALSRYRGFERGGFEVKAAFDMVPEVVTLRGGEVPVLHADRIAAYVEESGVRLAILCVPAESAQEVVNDLVAAGVQGILNFSPCVLQVPESVTVNNVDLALELENLSYFVNAEGEQERRAPGGTTGAVSEADFL